MPLRHQAIYRGTPTGPAAETLAAREKAVLDAAGLVVRYGHFYGPGTLYEGDPPPHPRIQIDAAAELTVPLLDASGIALVEEDPAEAALQSPRRS